MGLDHLHQGYIKENKVSTWFCSIHDQKFLCRRIGDDPRGSNQKTYCPQCWRDFFDKFLKKDV